MDETRSQQASGRAGEDAANQQHWVDLHTQLNQKDDGFYDRGDGQAVEDGDARRRQRR